MDKFIICLLGLYGIVMLLMCILQYYTVFLNNKKSINQVHFYIARDRTGNLWLYMGKPFKEGTEFYADSKKGVFCLTSNIKRLGLKYEDFNNLKWEDGPVEVFLNRGN